MSADRMCGAKTRTGAPCCARKMRGAKRCRMHGGCGSGAPRGNRNAVKHGLFTAKERALRHALWRIEKQMREALGEFG